MKVVFPCKGVIVLTKEDVQTLNSFYTTNLMTSKVYEIYNTSEFIIQVGNFNYLPKKKSLVLDESQLLSIPKLRSILNMPTTTSSTTSPIIEDVEENNELSDETILSHPFFKTLKPLD